MLSALLLQTQTAVMLKLSITALVANLLCEVTKSPGNGLVRLVYLYKCFSVLRQLVSPKNFDPRAPECECEHLKARKQSEVAQKSQSKCFSGVTSRL